MVYVLAVAIVAGQLVAPACSAAGVVSVAFAGALLAAAGAGPGRGTAVLRAAGVGLVAGAVGAGLAAWIERPPAAASDVAQLALPWRGELEAVVVGSPVRRGGRMIVVADVDRVGSGANARSAQGRVRLSLRRPRALHAGDRFRAWATLRRPRSFRSPGAFDFAGYLARRGIHVVGGVWEAPPLERREGRRRGVAVAVARWRRDAERALARGVAPPTRAILAALILGRSDGLPPDLREQFRRAGVLHVLVVSGLHVTLVASMAAGIAGGLLVRSERIALATDVTRLARLASVLPVVAYVVLVGPSVSVARAALGTLLAVAAVAWGRTVTPARAWAVALGVVAMLWPGTPREASFQLSFASVAGVLLVAPDRSGVLSGLRARLAAAARIAWTVSIVTAPVMAVHFDALAPMGVIANPLVVPLFGAAVLGPGLLGAALAPFSPAAASGLFMIAGWLVRPGLAAVEVLGGRWAVPLPVPRPNGLEVAAFYGVLGGWYGRRWVTWRVVGIGAALVLAVDVGWWVCLRQRPGPLRVAFLDVGQGDAAVVELPDRRVLVVDGGGVPGSDIDPGQAVVEPYLRSRKIGRLEVVAMSHAHPDHATGLPRLLERFQPREFWWAGIGGTGAAWEAIRRTLDRAPIRMRTLGRESAVPPPFRSNVTVLHPPPRWPADSLNDASLVLRVAGESTAVLFAGDVEAAAEAAAGATDGLASEVLKVPHHGSRTSSTRAWVAAVRPRIAVVSVGAGNSYGLPAPEVETRYAAAGACVLRTDRCGTIVVESRGGLLSVTSVVDAPACRCRLDQVAAPSPFRSAYMTRPTRSRTPSF